MTSEDEDIDEDFDPYEEDYDWGKAHVKMEPDDDDDGDSYYERGHGRVKQEPKDYNETEDPQATMETVGLNAFGKISADQYDGFKLQVSIFCILRPIFITF